MSEQKVIGLQKKTYDELTKLKKTGQSYNGVIADLIKVYKATIENTV